MGCLDQLRDFRLNALVENFFKKEQMNAVRGAQASCLWK